MSKDIAVVTASGRAYYLLAKELKRREIPFLSRAKMEEVPPQVKIVISTEEGTTNPGYRACLIYNEKEDPSAVIDKAVEMAHGSPNKRVLYIGVDPGKSTGIAAVCEHGIIHQASCPTVEASVETIMRLIVSTQAGKKVVRLGDGGEPHSSQILRSLASRLSRDVELEIVREEGTSRSFGEYRRKKRSGKDVLSAVVISTRQGKPIERNRRTC